MQGYPADKLELALGKLWKLVRGRLSAEELKYLGINPADKHYCTFNHVDGIFQELYWHGPGGPVGLGLGRMGSHSVG